MAGSFRPLTTCVNNIARPLAMVVLLAACFGQSCNVSPSIIADNAADPQLLAFTPPAPDASNGTTNDAGSSQLERVIDAYEGYSVTVDLSDLSGPNTSTTWAQQDGLAVVIKQTGPTSATVTLPSVDSDAIATLLVTTVGSATPTTILVTIKIHDLTSLLVNTDFSLSATEGVEPLSVDMAVTTVSGSPVPAGNYSWRFGDNSGAEGTQVKHSYNAGTWVVTLCATFGPLAGCKDKTITVQKKVVPTTIVTTAKIAGTIKLNGIGLAGFPLTASNAGGSTTTAADGAYSLTVPIGWSGDITPQLSGFTMTPTALSFTNVQSDLTGQSFSASAAGPVTARISGSVKLNGSGMAGVAITATNGASSTATTADGGYSLTVPAGWTGTVSAQIAGYTMSPASIVFTNLQTDRSAQSFTATLTPPSSFTISGSVKLNAVGLAGVTLTATGVTGSTTTGSDGNYTITVPSNWSGTITPIKSGSSIIPASKTFAGVQSNQTGQDFTATILSGPTVAGQVQDRTGAGKSGVTLIFTGTGSSAGINVSTTSAANGSFAQAVPSGWSGTLSSDANYRLDPVSTTLTNVTAPVSGLIHAAFRNYYVATTGSDNQTGAAQGRIDNPFATLAKAFKAIAAGDTVNLRAGTYSGVINGGFSRLYPTASGTPDAYITLKNYSDEHVVIDSPYNTTGGDFTFIYFARQIAYWHISGLTILNFGIPFNCSIDTGYPLPSHDLIFENIEASYCNYAPSLFLAEGKAWRIAYGTYNVTIRNCNIHHVGGPGIFVTGSSHDILVEDTQSHDNDDGRAADGGADGITVDYGSASISNEAGVIPSQPPYTVQMAKPMVQFPKVVDGSGNAIVPAAINNATGLLTFSANDAGKSIKSSYQYLFAGYPYNITIRRVQAYNNSQDGIDCKADNVVYDSCTVHDVGQASFKAWSIGQVKQTTFMITNCLTYGNTQQDDVQLKIEYMPNLTLYNNTFVHRSDDATVYVKPDRQPSAPSNWRGHLTALNNIFISDGGTHTTYPLRIDTNAWTSVTCDHNIFATRTPASNHYAARVDKGTNSKSYTDSQATNGTLLADTGFGSNLIVSWVAFSDYTNNDLHLSVQDTIARNRGLDLSSMGVILDLEGYTRPAGLFDLGCYEEH